MRVFSCRCIYVTFYLIYSSSNHLHKEDHPKDVALFDRIRQAINCRLAVTDVMRVYGPTKITVGDFWTSIPPSEQTLREEKKVQESVPDHTPGWLMSTVCFIKYLINHLFIYLIIYLFTYIYILSISSSICRRLYFDPLLSKERKMNGNDRLRSLIENIRCPYLT